VVVDHETAASSDRRLGMVYTPSGLGGGLIGNTAVGRKGTSSAASTIST
jgi:hypothetical protein